MKIAVIGGGAMGATLIKAATAAKVAEQSDFAICEVDSARRTALAQSFPAARISPSIEAAGEQDLAYLAIKPQDLPGLRGKPLGKMLIVSIMAGVPIAAVREATGAKRIVRAMPNTPAQINRGFTVWTATDDATPADRSRASALFDAMGGQIEAADESVLDKATAVSGSGPAYVFLFLEAFANAAVSIGLNPADARRMALETVIGAAEYAKSSDQHFAALKDQVTSPAGTTAAGLRELERRGFRSALFEAVHAAHARAEELGRS